jgi:hypothetical protein
MHARSTGFPFPVPLSALLSLGRDWASVPDRVGVVQDMCTVCMHACAIPGNIREYVRGAGGVSTMSLLFCFGSIPGWGVGCVFRFRFLSFGSLIIVFPGCG